MVLDGSPSMFTEDSVGAAKAAAAAFINDLDPSIDQVGGTVFSGFAVLDAPLTNNGALAASEINAACKERSMPAPASAPAARTTSSRVPGGVERASRAAAPPGRAAGHRLPLRRRQQRHRSDAEIAAVKAAGIRVISLGYGASVNVAEMKSDRQLAQRLLLRAVGGRARLDLRQHRPGHLPDGPAAGERRRQPGALRGAPAEHADAAGRGPRRRPARRSRPDVDLDRGERPGAGGVRRRELAGHDVLFTDPGTYVLQLEATDGFLTTAAA